MVYAHSVTRVTLSGTMFNGAEEWSTGFFLGQEGADATPLTQAGLDQIRVAWAAFMQGATSAVSNAYQFVQAKSALIDASGHTLLDEVKYSYPTSATYGASTATKLTAVRRFEQEAKAAGRIGSEHIVEVLDLGSLPSGENYMVMEFLECETFDARIKWMKRLAPHQAAPIVIQLLEGLAAARSDGVTAVLTAITTVTGPVVLPVVVVLAALAWMEGALDRPLDPTALAAVAGITRRQLERLFRDRLGRSMGRQHLDLRLDAARRLVSQTAMPLVEAAVATGFVSLSHFSRAYRARFGLPPGRDRARPSRES